MRPRVRGASVFFTVALAKRGGDLLVREVELLRAAVRETLSERPVTVEAWVVLPDHLLCVWTLPEGDSEYGVRWGAIKARFVMKLRRAGFSPPSELPEVRSGRFAGLKPGLPFVAALCVGWVFNPPWCAGGDRGWWGETQTFIFSQI